MPQPSRQPPPARRTLATVEIGGDHAELQVRNERYFLTGAGDSEQELTQAEADQLRRHAGDLTARAEARGLLVDDSPLETTSWLAARRRELPADRLTVLVDTTTFNNARDALYPPGRGPAAIALLDLSVLTAAATLFDTIVMQPERFAPLEDTRDLTKVLHPSAAGRPELERIYRDVWEGVSRPDQVATYTARWAEFLGVPPDEIHVDLEPVQTLNAEMTFDYSSTEEIAAAFGRARGREAPLARALGIHTVRTGFNDAIAGALGVPYLATSVRLPVSSRLANRKTNVLSTLSSLIAKTSPPGRAERATFAPRALIAAPLLLGLVLERMSKPDDYRGALDEVRERFAPLRVQLREVRETAEWNDKPHLYLERFDKYLRGAGATAAVQGAVTTAAQMGVTAATGDPGFATAVLKAIGAAQAAELAHRTYLRLWRPEIYVLLNVADEARRLSLLHRRIEQIWGSELNLTQQELLERFARLRADPFLTPTVVG